MKDAVKEYLAGIGAKGGAAGRGAAKRRTPAQYLEMQRRATAARAAKRAAAEAAKEEGKP